MLFSRVLVFTYSLGTLLAAIVSGCLWEDATDQAASVDLVLATAFALYRTLA